LGGGCRALRPSVRRRDAVPVPAMISISVSLILPSSVLYNGNNGRTTQGKGGSQALHSRSGCEELAQSTCGLRKAWKCWS
jgi:hypothetical protein